MQRVRATFIEVDNRRHLLAGSVTCNEWRDGEGNLVGGGFGCAARAAAYMMNREKPRTGGTRPGASPRFHRGNL